MNRSLSLKAVDQISSLLAILLISLCFLSLKPIELDAPLPADEHAWQQIPGEISLILEESTQEMALRFVIEEQGPDFSSEILVLDQPKNQEEVSIFLQKCKSYIETTGSYRAAFVAIGCSLVEQLQRWVEESVRQTEEKAPDLKNIVFGSSSLQVRSSPEIKDPSLLVSYGFILPKMKTSRDLRKLWSLALVEYMTTKRLQDQKIQCHKAKEFSKFLLPEKSITYQLKYVESEKGFKAFLKVMQEIKQVGFTLEELNEARQSFHNKLGDLQQTQPGKGLIVEASFHAEGFLRNMGLLSYGYFLESAATLIDSITPVDIAITLNDCYGDAKRHIVLLTNPSQSDAMEICVQKELDESNQLRIERVETHMATELLIDPEMSHRLFTELEITEHDKELIFKIIDTMARDNVIKLGLKRRSMERKGRKVRHVHPLKFLGHIFADPHLHQCMREVHRSHFKWNGFIDGLKDRIKEESSRGNLLPYVPAFAKQTNRDGDKIAHYIERRDWEGLVRYLL